MSESIAYNMDCMEYMRSLPDKVFDLACVDPPYGDGRGGQCKDRFGERFDRYKSGGGTTDSAGGSTDTKRPRQLRFHGGDRWDRYLQTANTPPRSTKLRVGGRTYRYLPPRWRQSCPNRRDMG